MCVSVWNSLVTANSVVASLDKFWGPMVIRVIV